ncbi:MAG: hypothetical protein P9M14_01220, partial [Candidatus Alcyoniella australis]|nr:hypothetical protein [Candidatus Alcyoniella australis]
LLHTTLVSGEWVNQTIEPMPECGGMLAAAIDGQDRIHLVWYKFTMLDKATLSQVIYGLYDGEWSFSQVHAGSRLLRELRLALDNADEPWVAFVEEVGAENENNTIHLCAKNGSAWDDLTIDDYSGPSFLDLEIDSSGRPNLLLLDPFSYEIALKIRDNGQWLHESVAQLEQRTYVIALALDGTDRPHVVFTDREDSQVDSRLYYALDIDQQWVSSLIDPARLGYEAELSWTSAGELYALYSVDTELKIGRRVEQ